MSSLQCEQIWRNFDFLATFKGRWNIHFGEKAKQNKM